MSHKVSNTTWFNDSGDATFNKLTTKNIFQLNAAQGLISGYTLSGGSPVSYTTAVEKYSFVTDANATDIGDVVTARASSCGQSSSTHGYTSGGYIGPLYANEIEKIPFASEGTGSDVGNLSTLKGGPSGQSSSTNGYAASGVVPPFTPSIDRFPFASDASASNIGAIVTARYSAVGISSVTEGYTAGGSTPADSDVVDRFPFTAPFATSTDTGNLTVGKRNVMGQNSDTYGYVSGGHPGPASPAAVDVVERFPFTAPFATATDAGDLSLARTGAASSSSATNGYSAGGNIIPSPVATTDTIDRFQFAGFTTATDVGNLTASRRGQAGAQY